MADIQKLFARGAHTTANVHGSFGLVRGTSGELTYGIAVDYVRLALAHVLTASCERANKLLHSGFSGLPTGLREDDGSSEDGLAITVYGANAAAANSDPSAYDYIGRFFYTRLTHTF